MAASSSARACCRSASSMWPFPVWSSRALLAAVPNALLVEDRADTPDFTLVLLLLLDDDRMSDVGGIDGRKERTDKKNTEGPFQRVRNYVVRKRKRERGA